jgi:hypothetical protein
VTVLRTVGRKPGAGITPSQASESLMTVRPTESESDGQNLEALKARLGAGIRVSWQYQRRPALLPEQ